MTRNVGTLVPRSVRAVRPCPGAPPFLGSESAPRSGARRLPGIPSPGTGPHRRLGRSGGGALRSSAPRSPGCEPQADDPRADGRSTPRAGRAHRRRRPAPPRRRRRTPRPVGMIGSASPATYATTSSETSIVWPLPWARSHPCSSSSIASTAGLNAAGTSRPAGSVTVPSRPRSARRAGPRRPSARPWSPASPPAASRPSAPAMPPRADIDSIRWTATWWQAELVARGRLGLVLGGQAAEHRLDRGQHGVPGDDRVEAPPAPRPTRPGRRRP